MPIYSLSQRTSATSAGVASWEIRTTANARANILEVGLSQNTAVAGVYGLGRPAAIGITPTTPQTFLAEDAAEAASTITACVQWGTGPTSPVNFFRRVSCPATIGAGVIWTFPRGLIIPVSSSLIIWILATAPVCDVWAVIEE
jgi:hypothetical protein